MRGKCKDDSYFAEKLKKSDADVVNFESLTEKAVAEKGESDRGAQWGFAILCTTYQNRFNLLYTAGNRDGDLKPCFEGLLKYYVKTWEPKQSYFDLIKVLSLAVLLDVKTENEQINALIGKIKDSDFRDYMADFLIRAIDSAYESRHEEFRWKNTYQPLQDIAANVTADTPEQLKHYLDKQWYGIHKECAWYGSHKTNFYYGYWSFETGALVKIMGIDDSALREQNCYPYDLVHRTENE